METTPFTLDNGLKILVRETHHNPVVTVDAWVNTGSINEPPAINGVSHFLEHMLFKGTATRGPNELDLMIEAVGGNWNAATSKDYTHYYCTVASPHKKVAMDAVADMLRNSLIDPEEMEKERLVILEEYLRKQDSPSGVLWEEAYAAAYEPGPYHYTVLGGEDTIKSIDNDSMRDYFERYYSPENLVVIVAGDVTTEEARDMAEEYFGDWKRAYKPFDGLDLSPRYRSGASITHERDINDTYYAMTFPGPSAADEEDVLALDLLEGVLSTGASSRLHQRLVEDARLSHGVGCSAVVHRLDGFFALSAVLEREKLEEFRAETLKEIEKVKRDGVAERELERAKTGIHTSTAFRTETTTGQTGTIGYCHVLSGDTRFEETYLPRLMDVPAEELQRVANKYLDPQATNEVIVQPRNGKSA